MFTNHFVERRNCTEYNLFFSYSGSVKSSWENFVRSGIRTHAHIRGPERSIPENFRKVINLESGALDHSAILICVRAREFFTSNINIVFLKLSKKKPTILIFHYELTRTSHVATVINIGLSTEQCSGQQKLDVVNARLWFMYFTKEPMASVGVEPTTFALLARRSNRLS